MARAILPFRLLSSKKFAVYGPMKSKMLVENFSPRSAMWSPKSFASIPILACLLSSPSTAISAWSSPTPAQRQVGVVVEEVLGKDEIVIKNLGEYLRRVKLFPGTTIAPDGSLILLLDLNRMVASRAERAQSHSS